MGALKSCLWGLLLPPVHFQNPPDQCPGPSNIFLWEKPSQGGKVRVQKGAVEGTEPHTAAPGRTELGTAPCVEHLGGFLFDAVRMNGRRRRRSWQGKPHRRTSLESSALIGISPGPTKESPPAVSAAENLNIIGNVALQQGRTPPRGSGVPEHCCAKGEGLPWCPAANGLSQQLWHHNTGLSPTGVSSPLPVSPNVSSHISSMWVFTAMGTRVALRARATGTNLLLYRRC